DQSRRRVPLCRVTLRSSLDAKRRQLLNRSAQRGDVVVGVMVIHFRARVSGELLPPFHGDTSIRHDARERMPERVKRERVHAATLLALPFSYDFAAHMATLHNARKRH